MSDIEVNPYDSSGLVKTKSNSISLNYTNQDFYSLKTRLVNFINERFGEDGTVLPNTFDDLIESDLAIMLMEIWAFIGDTLSFKSDQIANELFIDTVTEIENAFRISKLVGFKPQAPVAGKSMWSATLNNTVSTDVIIPTPHRVNIVANDTPTRIELFPADSYGNPIFDQDIVIPSGATSNLNIAGVEGRTIVQEFTADGSTSQAYELSYSPVIYDSVRVEVDGVVWNEVEYFTDSQPRPEFRVEFNSEYTGFVIFGNNKTGLIPSNGSVILVTYRVGGGTIGNIVTGYVETQTQVAVPGLDFPVPIALRNYTKGEGGYNGDTINDIRKKLPAWLRTQNRAVSGEDYKTLADQFVTPYNGSIGKSVAILRNHGCAGNVVDLYILAKEDTEGLQIASDSLKYELKQYLNDKKMLTDFLAIRDGVVLEIDVTVDVTLDKFYKKFEVENRAKIEDRIDTFFSLNNWEYGKTLKESDLVKELSDIKEIKAFDLEFTTVDPENSGNIVTTKFYEIIRPDEVTISFNYE